MTDDDLRNAHDRFAAGTPGFAMPVAHDVARGRVDVVVPVM